MRTTRSHPTRRGSVIVIVMWAIAITSILCASIQLFSFRQATVSHGTLNRVQARWTARAGIENTIAMLALHTEQPIAGDARALINDLAAISAGELRNSTYAITHSRDGFEVSGPLDDHSKVNANRPGFPIFELMEDMSPDQMAAMMDWTDDDDEPSMFGAEADFYLANYSYTPRNGAFRSIAELELVAGIWAEYVRGEDHNLNGRLDPNENDGDRTAPSDVADNWLDAGWSSLLSVYSYDHGSSESGLPRIHLRRAEEGELEDRCNVSPEQARILKAFGRNYENSILDLLTTPLSSIGPDGQTGSQAANGDVEDLTDEQITEVLSETRVRPLFDRQPGRVNINTASFELIESMVEAREWEPTVADDLIYLRDSQLEGVTSVLKFREVQGPITGNPGASNQLARDLADMFCVSSNVFMIASRGRSSISGTEIEIIVVVDRSTLPVRILEYREQ